MNTDDIRALEDRLRAYVARHMASMPRARVVLAASGGADSSAMVALLIDAGIIDPARAIVAHFDHRLRDESSARRDLTAVRVVCDRFALPLETGAWTTPRTGEAAAREARYRFLHTIAGRHAATAVITGHTAGDQAETVLMHIIRGAGLRGLAGMAPVAPLPVTYAPAATGTPPPQLFRPLLCVSRAETRTYCATRDIAYADDPTNDDTTFLRNRVRLELLPQLDAISAGAREALSTLAAEARESLVALDAIASTALVADPAACGDATAVLSREALRRLPASVVPHAYRLALARLLGDPHDFERRHYDTLARAASAATGSSFELPRRIVATVDADAVVLSVGPPEPPQIATGWEAAVPFSGLAGAWQVRIEAADCSSVTQEHDHGDRSRLIALPAGSVLRSRRPGDRVALRGGGHKKLQDLYVDAKVPRRERDAAPVIAFAADVLWTPLNTGAIADAAVGQRYHLRCQRRELASARRSS